MVKGYVQAIFMIVCLHHYGAQQGPFFQIKGEPCVFGSKIPGLDLAFWLRQLPQIMQRDRKARWHRLDHLDWSAIEHFERRAPNLVTTDKFKEAVLDDIPVECTVTIYSQNLVVEGNVGCHLSMKPDL